MMARGGLFFVPIGKLLCRSRMVLGCPTDPSEQSLPTDVTNLFTARFTRKHPDLLPTNALGIELVQHRFELRSLVDDCRDEIAAHPAFLILSREVGHIVPFFTTSGQFGSGVAAGARVHS